MYLHVHGLIFETSIWLLAGSTRYLQRDETHVSRALCYQALTNNTKRDDCSVEIGRHHANSTTNVTTKISVVAGLFFLRHMLPVAFMVPQPRIIIQQSSPVLIFIDPKDYLSSSPYLIRYPIRPNHSGRRVLPDYINWHWFGFFLLLAAAPKLDATTTFTQYETIFRGGPSLFSATYIRALVVVEQPLLLSAGPQEESLKPLQC